MLALMSCLWRVDADAGTNLHCHSHVGDAFARLLFLTVSVLLLLSILLSSEWRRQWESYCQHCATPKTMNIRSSSIIIVINQPINVGIEINISIGFTIGINVNMSTNMSIAVHTQRHPHTGHIHQDDTHKPTLYSSQQQRTNLVLIWNLKQTGSNLGEIQVLRASDAEHGFEPFDALSNGHRRLGGTCNTQGTGQARGAREESGGSLAPHPPLEVVMLGMTSIARCCTHSSPLFWVDLQLS